MYPDEELCARYSLYECGGNLNERRLDPLAYIHEIVSVNQDAIFQLRYSGRYIATTTSSSTATASTHAKAATATDVGDGF